MEVKTITYKRVNSLGSYSSETLEMVAQLIETDDPEQCAKDLKNSAEVALGLKQKSLTVDDNNSDLRVF